MAEQWRQLFGIEAIEMSPQFDSWEGPGAPALFRDGAGCARPGCGADADGFVALFVEPGAQHHGRLQRPPRLTR